MVAKGIWGMETRKSDVKGVVELAMVVILVQDAKVEER